MTLPFRVLASIELRFESNKNTLEKSIMLVPCARPVSVRIASVPLPVDAWNSSDERVCS